MKSKIFLKEVNNFIFSHTGFCVSRVFAEATINSRTFYFSQYGITLRNVSGNVSSIEKLNEKKMNVVHKEMTVEDVAIEMGLLISMGLGFESQLYF